MQVGGFYRSRGQLALASLMLLQGGCSDQDLAVELAGSSGCALDELTLPDGRCQRVGIMDMACAPGELTGEDGVCQPAGVPPAACAGGFEPDGDRGCRVVLSDAACPQGQMTLPGEGGCRAVAPCGDGPWGNIPVEPTTEFVDRAYAGNDSDGSRLKPWRTLGEGVSAAAPGAIVAISDGRYAEDVVITSKSLRLWGRCPDRVELVGTGIQDAAVVIARERASGTEVHGLAISGAKAGLVVRTTRGVVVDGVWIHDARGPGAEIDAGAEATLRGSLIERNQDIGVLMVGSDATIETSVIRSTREDRAGRFGRGVSVEPGAGQRSRFAMRASLIEQNRECGVSVVGSDALVEASVVRATGIEAGGGFGDGLRAVAHEVTRARAKLTLRGSLVEQNRSAGVLVVGSDAEIEASVIRATRPAESGEFGVGVLVEERQGTGERGALTLRRSLVDRNHDIGVFVTASDAIIEGAAIRATQLDGHGRFGRGVQVQLRTGTTQRGTLVLRGSLVEQNLDRGVLIQGSDAAIESAIVRSTTPGPSGYGVGISVQDDILTAGRGLLSLKASLVEQNHIAGVLIQGSDAAIESSVVRSNLPDATGAFGQGVAVSAEPASGLRGALEMRASLIEQNHQMGVIISGSDVKISASIVRDTKRTLQEEGFGDGIGVIDDAGVSVAEISDTQVTGNARVGILFVNSLGAVGPVRLSKNRFGLVLQGTQQPALTDGNLFEGNSEGDKLIDGDLPVPSAPPTLP